jgi:heme oxygenase
LGGQILKKKVREAGDFPTRFFEGYGSQTATMWREFRESAANYAERHGGRERMIASAKETFETLQCWLEEAARQ